MKKIFGILCMAAAMTACAGNDGAPYKVIVAAPQAPDGTVLYLSNLDTKEKLDSVEVSEGTATFKGNIDEPIIASIATADRTMGTTLFLEDGTISANLETSRVTGSQLNDAYNELEKSVNALVDQYRAAKTDAERDSIEAVYTETIKKAICDNADNPIGVFLLVQDNPFDDEELLALVEANPWMKEYQNVQTILEKATKRAGTAVGKMFTDFEVTYNGETKKLSDYVGKGEYVLVDFFASWCGPCMRELPYIKQVYDKYNGKGLKVLGVAVWDEPEATEKCINDRQIPWECIINAQSVPTEIYGIAGIPTLILFGPDGKIIDRTARGEGLVKLVDTVVGGE